MEGVTVVPAETYKKSGSLPREANEKLSRWLKRLPPLADEIPPVSRVHGYSGRWEVRNNFSRWRGQEVKNSDVVYFAGDTFLLLSVECGRGQGAGSQTGKLYIKVRNYTAVYQIANRVLRATVAEDGTLNMHVVVLSRECIDEEGEPPEADYGSKLFGSKEFDLELKIKSGESKQLFGRHEYWVADKLYQIAEEMYTYIGI